MWETIIKNSDKYTSTVDNIEEVKRVVNDVSKQLKEFNEQLFYKKEDWNVTYNLDLVKNYLQSLSGYSEQEMIQNRSYSTYIMAIQILLESMWYDVWKIDGRFWPETKKIIKAYQEKNWLLADWIPWKDFLDKLKQDIDNPIEKAEGKEKWIEREDEKEPISEENYEKFFDWDLFENFFRGSEVNQQSLGDCRLVAAIDSVAHLDNFKSLIMSSVFKTKTGFIIRLPLSESDKTESAEYAINIKNMYSENAYVENFNQVSTKWDCLRYLKSTKCWLESLAVAVWQKLTGLNNFDVSRLTWWCSDIALNVILGNKFWYIGRNNEELFRKVLFNRLEHFQEGKDVMVLSVKQGNNYDEMSPLDWWNSNHAICVRKVYKEGDVMSVELANPWCWSRTYKKSFEEIFESCGCIYLSGSNQKNKSTEFRNRQKWTGTIWWNIENNWPKHEGLRRERWEVLVNDLWNNKLNIKSWGHESDIIHTNNWYNISFDWYTSDLWIKEQELWSWNYRDNFYLFAPKISTFISRMRSNYIDKYLMDETNENPFSLDKNWNLVFDDDPRKLTWHDWFKRSLKEKLWDDTITCLNDRSELWINDDSTKQKIVDILNKLCKVELY